MPPAFKAGGVLPKPADLNGPEAVKLKDGVFVRSVPEDGVARVMVANEVCTMGCYLQHGVEVGRGFCLPEIDLGLPEGSTFITTCMMGTAADSVEACELFIKECVASLDYASDNE